MMLTLLLKNDNIVSDFIVKGNQLFLPHDVSLNRSGEILDILKPYRNINGEIKTAHISNNRWNSLIKLYPNSFVATVSIQDFLDLTADRLAQRAINNESAPLNETRLKETGDPTYLKFDYAEKMITDHEGRHRLTALLNSGYTHADVFIIPMQNISADTIQFITLQSQGAFLKSEKGNVREITLHGLVKASSENYKAYIDSKFKIISDNNIRYSLKTDSEGNKLSSEQIEFFKDSKVRDDNGSLKVVYHGTPNIFNIFKSGIGGLYGAGVYFTEDIKYADNYTNKYQINGKTYTDGRIVEAYLKMENPLIVENRHDLDDFIYKKTHKLVTEKRNILCCRRKLRQLV